MASIGARTGANIFTTALLAINVAVTGLYFLRQGHGFARKAVGWVLLSYAPVYVVSLFLDLAYPDSRASSILILASDFVLNNAFVVGLFAIMEEQARDELRRLAVTDQLTGALNRVGLMGKFPDGHLLNARALLLADLDHFKSINDTYGHTGGDVALKTFVDRASELLGKDEFIARIGGEEFGILLATSDVNDACWRADQIRQRLAGEPVVWSGRRMALTTSIGIAVASGSEDLLAVMTRADDALYRAKRGGRNRVAA
ncbi:GGDEF domain-containing protein [Rhizobium sp. S152]|uniref:GGDEF domain-containing protein n=1 Tax=Rhizobium sp. S152 TaxID=3055038 RepID=UPI0025A94FDC|nr:GGDEF domain-containing protein [Rhizobium sp. S152]MDM9627588.1 GGDEF domain-containing protein [Rhizobium sp. S152]